MEYIVYNVCSFTMPVAPTLMQECLVPRRCKYFPPEKQIRQNISFKPSHLNLWINEGASYERFIREKFLLLTICQTCMILSSDTEHMTHGSLGFHEKSEILAVCPPWMNWNKIKKSYIESHCTIAESALRTIVLTRSSGGPSSASSADCSSPILLKCGKNSPFDIL